MQKTPGDAITMAGLMLLLLGGAAAWHAHVLVGSRPAERAEAWAHIRQRFPTPDSLDRVPQSSPAVLEAVVRANPFSPLRQQTPKKPEQPRDAAAAAPKPIPPQWMYKGRIVMGSGQRAILEDVTAKKTYFLQLGQDVAGFKVLDIQETRVLLSDLKTHEELTVSLTQSPQPSGKAPGKTKDALSNY